MLEFTVPGEPVSKLRARAGRGGRFYTPKKTVDYETRVKAHARGAMIVAGMKSHMEGPLFLRCVFYTSRKVTSKPDLDNLVKCVKDAMNQVVYDDDSQVVWLHAWKQQDPSFERTKVKVCTMEEILIA